MKTSKGLCGNCYKTTTVVCIIKMFQGKCWRKILYKILLRRFLTVLRNWWTCDSKLFQFKENGVSFLRPEYEQQTHSAIVPLHHWARQWIGIGPPLNRSSRQPILSFQSHHPLSHHIYLCYISLRKNAEYLGDQVTLPTKPLLVLERLYYWVE